MEIQAIVDRQKDFFKSQKTKDVDFRKTCLLNLRKELLKREKQIASRQITVRFEGEDLDMVLQVIAETLDLNLEKSNNAYFFSNKKFN